jgi:hypothetical protein
VHVFEGTVEFRAKATGQSVMVHAGESVSAGPAGLRPVARFDVESEAAEWDAMRARSDGSRSASSAPASPRVGATRGVNLALGKKTQQSSVAFGGAAERAADGNVDGRFESNSTTHTAFEPQPWWQVDLGTSQRIGTIRIWNRSDCCAERLSNFDVFVSDSPLPPGSVGAMSGLPGSWRFHDAGTAAMTTDVAVNQSGRYVRVQLEGTNYLHLAEVEVFGSGGSAPAVAAALNCAPEVTIFTNGNAGGVDNGPTRPTTFTLTMPVQLESLMTYHWNSGRGQPAGTVALEHEDGTRNGPWGVVGEPGQGGVPSAYWYARPHVLLKPGTYTVLDSHPASWAQNAQSGGQGIATVKGCPVPR